MEVLEGRGGVERGEGRRPESPQAIEAGVTSSAERGGREFEGRDDGQQFPLLERDHVS